MCYPQNAIFQVLFQNAVHLKLSYEISPMRWIEKQRASFLMNWYQINSAGLFISVCLLYFAAFMIKRMLIIDEIAAFEILQERGEMWLFDLFFSLQYLVVPFFLAWKFTLTTFLLWVGCFMFGYRLTFAQLWKMVMIFELVFIIAEFLKVIWFTALASDPTYQEYVAFYPLSLINFVDFQSIGAQWLYPLKALNLFELGYWALLIVGIYWLSNKKLRIAAIIVCSSYILFFFVWLGFYLVVYK
ncbi:MAG: hypothetical protein ACJA08_000891 [Cyclobacteriaceae bacterium]